jgi:DNA mismatch repair ATPase MutS
MAQTLNTCVASAYEAPPLRVMSLMGRSDSLIEGRSYYLDEVQRVLAMIRASRLGEPHLFLLDELFRGTNAGERIANGEASLRELRDAPTRHLIVAATHDLELVSLLSPHFATYHFTDRMDRHGMVFEYRLAEGPATTRNAIALLELQGAPASLVDRARALTHQLEQARRTQPPVIN